MFGFFALQPHFPIPTIQKKNVKKLCKKKIKNCKNLIRLLHYGGIYLFLNYLDFNKINKIF